MYDKIRAYQIQDTGKDTVEANEALGIKIDARDYRIAAAILKEFEISSVRLLTNNPDKIAGLEKEGIKVTRIPCEVPTTNTNKKYLTTKKQKMGHLLVVRDRG